MWPCTFHAPKQLFTETCRLKRVLWWTDVGSKIQEKGKVCVFQPGTSFISLVEWTIRKKFRCVKLYYNIWQMSHFLSFYLHIYNQHPLYNCLFYKLLCLRFFSCCAFDIYFFAFFTGERANNMLIWLKAEMPLTHVFSWIFLCVISSSSYLPRLDF